MALYGKFLEKGYGFNKKNPKEAVKYYKMSCERKNLTGYAYYGSALIDGIGGIPKNVTEGLRLIKISCDHKNSVGINEYAYYLFYGLAGINKNEKIALKYYENAANLGNALAFMNIGVFYEFGDGVEIDKKKALQFYKKGFEEGSHLAAYKMGRLLINEKINLKEGNKYLKYAAEQGNTFAMDDYIINMNNKNGVEMNEDDLMKFLTIGIYLEEKYIYFSYADLLYYNVPKDVVKAAKYYKKSADCGIKEAIQFYSYLLENGIGVNQNINEAERYRKMLEQS